MLRCDQKSPDEKSPSAPTHFKIAVIGSGFGGSIMSMIARKLGHTVTLIERGTHPRFAIGESSTPFSNLLLERIALEFDLPQLLPFTEWGRWQSAHPDITAGLKRGFTFYHHEAGGRFAHDPKHRNQLLVAASPRDELADTHWYRPEMDAYLVHEAQAMGVKYLDEAEIEAFIGLDEDSPIKLHARRGTERFEIECDLLIDATGPRGTVFRALNLQEAPVPNMPRTEALFSHFRSVGCWQEAQTEKPPYPPDAAAVHHVFAGGWIWILRFNNGITSAGITAEESLARELKLEQGAPAWHAVLERFPSLRALFRNSVSCEKLIYMPKLAFASPRVHGPNWLMLPSAAGFVDPLLSSGFALNFFGILRIGRALRMGGLSGEFRNTYANDTKRELHFVADLVSALYASMGNFERFSALTLLYFAAASFAESAWRLHRADLAESFLLSGIESFAAQVRGICERARKGEPFDLRSEVLQTIAPYDVAGLTQERGNWYPVNPCDLLAGHAKLGVSAEAVAEFLRQYGITVPLACAG